MVWFLPYVRCYGDGGAIVLNSNLAACGLSRGSGWF